MTTLGRAATFLLLANTDEEEEEALRYEVLGNDDAEQQRMEDIFTFCARLRCRFACKSGQTCASRKRV